MEFRDKASKTLLDSNLCPH